MNRDEYAEQLPAWTRFLPRQDLLVMLKELRTSTPEERPQVLEDWEVTARALTDQDAREVLLGYEEAVARADAENLSGPASDVADYLAQLHERREPAQAVGGSVPYPYEEQRLLLLAALRYLSAEHGTASDPPAETELAEDMLEEAASKYAHAVASYQVGKS